MPTPTTPLQQRLAHYAAQSLGLPQRLPTAAPAAALGTALLSGLALTPAAYAAEVVTNCTTNCTVNTTNLRIIDIDGAGGSDMFFSVFNGGVYLSGSGAIATSTTSYAGAYAPSAVISAGRFGGPGGSFGVATNGAGGQWLDRNAHFAGIRFMNGADTHYGWVEFTVPAPGQLQIARWGYNNTPNTASTTPSSFLPVELAAFDAVANKPTEVLLAWQTASETNNAGFHVERAEMSDAADAPLAFKPLAFVTGAGTTTEAQRYAFTDEAVRPGRSYAYRLKQIDYDGAVDYSPLVEITTPVDAFALEAPYPNPARGEARLVLTAERATEAMLRVYDVRGRLVIEEAWALSAGANGRVLDVSGLAAGTYFAEVAADGKRVHTRIVVAE